MSGADSLDLETIFEGGDPEAEEIANQWSSWNGARVNARERWKETTQYVYATSTRETNNADIGGFREQDTGWEHSTHIPKITQIFDNLSANYMSALLPHEDWFKFVGSDQESSSKEVRKKVEGYLKTKHRLNGLRNTVQTLIDDWIIYGNCFAMVTFESETQVDSEDPNVSRKGYIGPRTTRISPFDIVFNPLASDFEHSPKIIRSLKTLGELSRDIEDRPELGYSRDVFNKAVRTRNNLRQVNVEDFDKSVQMTFDGFGTASQYFTSGFVEILEFYGDMYDITNQKFLKNYVITIIDRQWVIRSEPLKTWSGKPNIFHSGWRFRQDNLWAMGPLENLVGIQYLLNHLENARADAFDQMLAPTRVLIGDVEEDDIVTGRPGGKYVIPTGEGSVTNLLPDTTVLTADIQIDRKMEQMEEFAGAPKQEMGIRTPGEKTATEVNLLGRASSRIFQNKLTQFEESFLDKVLNAELEVARRNLDQKDVINVLGETGANLFLDITKEDLMSNGRLLPLGAKHFARKEQLTNNMMLLSQQLAGDPLLQQHFPSVKLAELWEDLLDFDKLDLVLPWGRIAEQAEAGKLQNAAADQVESESMIAVSGDEEEEENEELAAQPRPPA